ncbi:glycan-binding surface protein [Proteiniphilum sp. X52]|uniref:glycan-binding surface protein n=1 Tax=Proteiniphilum sp. X52 TaxID=2382159 RepID=UPI000F0A3929|nr:glycan-binding surface protein [Proteiniphilum sp. X52]RNC66203.1 hypothetical protein D7D25_04565 [Proteiniphilum sp. X52]
MKNNIYIIKPFSFVLLTATLAFFVACDDGNKGKYEMTDGVPTIDYVRLPDIEKADSLLVGAFMGETICLVGDNLTSIQEIYFNDVKALLNINFITRNTLLVTIPREVPNEVIDKIVMILKSGEKAEYDFIVRIPAPEVASIKCEQVPQGEDVVLYGDYFFDNQTVPLTIVIGDYIVPKSDIVDIQKTQVTFKSPSMDVKGAVSVTTAYGNSGRTKFVFHDDRGILFNFDDYPIVPGWGRPTLIETGPDALSGNYMKFRGELLAGEWVSPGDNYQCNFWGEDNGMPAGNLFPSDPATSILKFEVNVLQEWSALPMNIFFGPQKSEEALLWDDSAPRAQWIPWKEAGGAYKTDGWVTVSIPIADFRLSGSGEDLEKIPTHYGSLNMYIYNRGRTDAAGTDCDPVILIDNVRVVPGE